MEQNISSKKKQKHGMFEISGIVEEKAHIKTSRKDKEALQAIKMHPCLNPPEQESTGLKQATFNGAPSMTSCSANVSLFLSPICAFFINQSLQINPEALYIRQSHKQWQWSIFLLNVIAHQPNHIHSIEERYKHNAKAHCSHHIVKILPRHSYNT